jgi:hypothetical protein
MKDLIVILLFLTAFACSEDERSIESPTVPNLNDSTSNSIKLLEDDFNGIPLVLVGSTGRNFVVGFKREFAGGIRSFSPIQKSLPVIMEDDLGNRWDIFGKAVFGPNQGEYLETTTSGMGFWFSFSAFYPGMQLHGYPDEIVDIQVDTSPGWNVPSSYVAQGAGFDGIPSITNPEFSKFRIVESDPSENFYLEDDDLVIIVSNKGEHKVYPHAILDWHEVINDDVGGDPLTITYCPLTGTGRVWKREGTDGGQSFGVSGYLYNSNLLAFDRETETLWSQITAAGIFGQKLGEHLEVHPFVETSWQTTKILFDEPLVMTENTGYDRNYLQYPYGDYASSNLLSYPVLYIDDRLTLKERVFCMIMDDQAKAYQLSSF